MFIAKFNNSGVQIKSSTTGQTLVSCGNFAPTTRAGAASELSAFANLDQDSAAHIDMFATGRLKWDPSRYEWDGSFKSSEGREALRADLKAWHAAYVQSGRAVANQGPIQIVDLPRHWGA